MSQSSPSNSKIESIQVLRGIAAFMVMLHHLHFSEQSINSSGTLLLPGVFLSGSAGVDLFFVISGFIMVTVTRKKLGQPGAVPEFLYSRFLRIYPLYWLFTSLIIVIGLFKPSLLNIPIGSGLKILQSFLLYPQEYFPILKVGWTLVHEIYFYLVFAVLLFLPARFFLKGLGTWLFLIILGSVIFWNHPPVPAGPLDIAINPLTVEFIFGCVIARLLQSSPPFPGGIVLGLGAASLLVVGLFFGNLGLPFQPLQQGWTRVAGFGLPCALIVYGSVALEKKRGRTFLPWLQPLGDASYSFYLIHLFILAAMVKLWQYVPVHSPITTGLWLGVMALSAIGAGLLVHRLIEKPLIDFTHAARGRLFPRKPAHPKNS